GDSSLFDVIEGALEMGISHLSAYAFSTENWKRSPDEVRFLLGFNRETIRNRRDELHARGVRVRWSGRSGMLWKSVLSELRDAEQMTRDNTGTSSQFCASDGGRAEIVDAAREVARRAAAGELAPQKITEDTLSQNRYAPEITPVDLFVRSS